MSKQEWSNPIKIEDYLARIASAVGREDISLEDANGFADWLKNLASCFSCSKHPEEGPSVEYTRGHEEIQIVCGPCRRAGR